MIRSSAVTVLAGFGLAVSSFSAPTPSGVDFQREVRPILSDACFHCHGPDKNTRMVGLRLDTQEGAFASRKSGAPIVPGNPEASLLYQRISAESAARRMPPVSSHKELTAKQIDTLKRWIAEGAPWSEQWSFVPPKRPELPAVKNQSWVRNPIDNFILARLEEAGLAPAPEADRRTLARRVSLDLTGLPPQPEDVDAFVNDSSPDAYEKLVDRLLASPRWGEHQAKYWLDAARYADTHGIHVDNYREMWPYRDWVINAFNRNMPFDQFTIEQIAGDMLPNPTLEQKIATGFHRCNVTSNEAGLIEDEYAAIYAKDRADTTGTVWLGLTVGCATCHDHKFDPISQKDFYSLTAFFRNTTQPVMDGNVYDTPPIVVVPRPEDRSRWSQLQGEEDGLRAKREQSRKSALPAFEKWVSGKGFQSIDTGRYDKSEVVSVSFEGSAKLQMKGKAKPLSLSEGVTLGEAPTPGRQALHFAKEGGLELPNVDFIDSDKPFSVAMWIQLPKSDDNFTIVSQREEGEKGRGWVIGTGARVPYLSLSGAVENPDPKKKSDERTLTGRAAHLEQLKPGEWTHLVVTYDGTREQTAFTMYFNGRPVMIQGGGDPNFTLPGSIKVKEPLRLGSDTKRFFPEGAIADFRIYNRVLTEEEARLVSQWYLLEDAHTKAPDQLSAGEKDALEIYYMNRENDSYRKVVGQLQDLSLERLAIRKRGAVTLVQEERRDQDPFAHILYRGMYDRPKDKVEPNVPAALPPMPASFPRNRLGLAKWLVDENNPLTGRVTTNRFWQQVFGTGIVKTAEDFGSQGQAPSHPELLDWMAIEFRDSGWDIKKFFKLMVTSATYRQAATATDRKLEKDPENRLLSRGPRFRMDAEMVRDYVLSVSGLLSDRIGGPSVKPYQPEGVWEAVAMIGSNTRFYKQDHGDKLYRRSLYTFWKRSAPPPSMDLFNAPTRETCTVRRERTNTPLQALVTMNDTQFVEAARVLAERAYKTGRGSIDPELDFLSRSIMARALDDREREISKGAYKDYLRYYDSNMQDARSLIATGESKADSKIPPPEFAALTMLTSQFLNLDEVLNK